MNENEINEKVESVFAETELLSVPVEVISMANFYGFSVYELDMDDNISGIIIADSKPIKNLDTNKAIAVNSTHSSARKRFTIAHELGHYILQNRPENCYAHRDTDGGYSPDERDANSFASALLMPEKDIRKFANYLSENNSGYLDFILISESAKRYNVSENAAEVRLKKLRII